jgi:hypothetical protein
MGSNYPPSQAPYSHQAAPYERPPSWWSRNKKWAIPVGCLGLLLALLLFLGFIAAIFFGVMGIVKSSGAYTEAVAQAQASPEVIQALGEPIEEGWFVTGNVNTSGPSGEAELAIPLSGVRDSGTLYVEARRRAGNWEFSVLELELKSSGERITLLNDVPLPSEVQ